MRFLRRKLILARYPPAGRLCVERFGVASQPWLPSLAPGLLKELGATDPTPAPPTCSQILILYAGMPT